MGTPPSGALNAGWVAKKSDGDDDDDDDDEIRASFVYRTKNMT